MNASLLNQSVDHWQIVYTASITLALLATFAIVVFAFHWEQHKAALRVSNYFYILFSLTAVIATIVIVVKTKALDKEKDRTANIQIAQANREAATAYQQAAEAKKSTEELAKQNTQLNIELTSHETAEKKAETDLATQTQKVNQFVQGVAHQQQNMAKQMQVTLSLDDLQIQTLASRLRVFAGQKISIHTMMDARSQRLAGQFNHAFSQAGLTVTGNSTDVGPNYTGVMVSVRSASPAPHPPLADAIANALREIGIPVSTVASGGVLDGEVAILIGPQ